MRGPPGGIPVTEGGVGAGGTCRSGRGPLMQSSCENTVSIVLSKKRLHEYSLCTIVPSVLRNNPEFLPEYAHFNTIYSHESLFRGLQQPLLGTCKTAVKILIVNTLYTTIYTTDYFEILRKKRVCKKTKKCGPVTKKEQKTIV